MARRKISKLTYLFKTIINLTFCPGAPLTPLLVSFSIRTVHSIPRDNYLWYTLLPLSLAEPMQPISLLFFPASCH